MENKDLPAYPYSVPDTCSGLTKREVFVLAAMQGFLANQFTGKQWDTLTIARQSVIQADAVLEELEKE